MDLDLFKEQTFQNYSQNFRLARNFNLFIKSLPVYTHTGSHLLDDILFLQLDPARPCQNSYQICNFE